MAGHSKWANIKHRKAAQDKKRGKLYTKLIREITVAARLGGGNPEDNPRLRASIDKALSANMPKETIDRAVQRGAGGGEDSIVEELVYEGLPRLGMPLVNLGETSEPMVRWHISFLELVWLLLTPKSMRICFSI